MKMEFNKEYYDRFYHNPKTRVVTQSSINRLGEFICAYLKYLEIKVDHVIDFGCGLGYWKKVIKKHFPDAYYEGVEISDYLCNKYGWYRGSVVNYVPQQVPDLVICQGVLQYLSSRDTKQAITNLARLTQGALYLEALTKGDWEENCNQDTTDNNVYLRRIEWYRKELGNHFVPCGGGLFIPHSSDVILYELEHL